MFSFGAPASPLIFKSKLANFKHPHFLLGMQDMKRRDFLKYAGVLTTQSIIASALLDSVFTSTSLGQMVSLKDLKNAVHPDDGMVLVPSDAPFAAYNNGYNKRTLKTPSVRVLCATPGSVITAIQWARNNNVPLAVRSGGHSFEGLSQGAGLIIDTRPMNEINIALDNDTFAAGAGALLGNVYGTLSQVGRSIPAGTCGTVGITGHTMGGGYGMLARPFGLACDSLLSVALVNVEGRILNCSATENTDLFWALRGGGAGSFGIVTKLQYRTHSVERVLTYGFGYKGVRQKTAARFMKQWQQWAPNAPREINSLMKVSRGEGDLVNLRFIGQSIGSEATLRQELSNITALLQPENLTIKDRTYMESVLAFGGSMADASVYMKGKSDYLKQVMSEEGLSVFLKNIPSGVDAMFDAYGGAISDVQDHETAFAHRAGTVCSIQYYTQWMNPSSGPTKLTTMKTFHDSLRPYMSGSAKFNYCDLDISNYAEAYWGKNLDRLREIKTQHDPENFFRHAQSIPLKKKG